MIKRLIQIICLFTLTSCASLPFLLKDAEIGLEAAEVAVEAEEHFVEEVQK